MDPRELLGSARMPVAAVATVVMLSALSGLFWGDRPQAEAPTIEPESDWVLPVLTRPDVASWQLRLTQLNPWGMGDDGVPGGTSDSGGAGSSGGDGASVAQGQLGRFSAIVRRGGDGYALMAGEGAELAPYRPGEALPDGGRIERVEGDRVVVEKGGERTTVELFPMGSPR